MKKYKLKNFTLWIKLLINELNNHFVSITYIILLFLLFWIVPQINDLIVVLNQAKSPWLVVPVFFSTLCVLAFLIGTVDNLFNNSSSEDDVRITIKKIKIILKIPKDNKEIFIEQQRLEGQTKSSKKFQENQSEYIRRIFPKVLGTFLILTVTFALNNTFFNIHGKNIIWMGNWGFYICIIILILKLNKNLVDIIKKRIEPYSSVKYIPISIVIVCFLGIIFFGIQNKGKTTDTVYLFYSLFLLTILFFQITTSYNLILLKIKNKYGAPIIAFLTLFIIITYIILLFYPDKLKILTPLPIIIICFTGFYLFLVIIKLIGFKYKIPLLTLTLLISIILSIYNASKENFSHYMVSTIKESIDINSRLTLDEYAHQWVEDRRLDILDSTKYKNKFPIILVAAEGGGSRAGLWSFLVQSYLFNKNPDYFKKYLFSMTGASGGGVGNNMFYTQVYNILDTINNKTALNLKYKTKTDEGFYYRASSIYKKDFLSTSVASLLGRDLFKNITGLFEFDDRGTLLENEWENAFNSTFNYTEKNSNTLGSAYLNMMPKKTKAKGKFKYIRPLLITNTTHLESGRRAVISPVSIEKDTNNMSVFIDLLKKFAKNNDSMMIKRSTAMSLNARFPYINPAGRIDKIGQFGDAGYYDNIGGSVTRRLGKTIKKVLEKDSILKGKYEIKYLIISNFEKEKDTVTFSSQLIAPVLMVLNATFAHSKEMEKTFIKPYIVQSMRTDIDYKDTIMKPIIPLGRFLSDAAILSLENRLVQVNDTLNALIKRK